jgi:hypothetical protein
MPNASLPANFKRKNTLRHDKGSGGRGGKNKLEEQKKLHGAICCREHELNSWLEYVRGIKRVEQKHVFSDAETQKRGW